MSVVYFLLSILGISVGSRWLENMSVDAEAYQLIERKRRIQWGRHAGSAYLWIEIPSWEWKRDFVRFDHWCWHQRVLLWRDGKGWSMWYRPETPG